MSENNMELMKWGDGTIRLTFWDNVHGDDIMIVLNEDGTAQQSVAMHEDGREDFAPVDLVATLRKMAEKWSNRP